VIPAQSVRKAIDAVEQNLVQYHNASNSTLKAATQSEIANTVLYFGALILLFALVKGFFMYLMRQTLIVMSRHIEYDLKNEIFTHYQRLPTHFYHQNSTGDLMARISEDVGRVRMYVGPAIMYIMNLLVTIIIVLWAMFSVNVKLSIIVLLPLPLLSYAIYSVNNIINKRSDAIQAKLSDLTSFVQQSFSGIRILKAFSIESTWTKLFKKETDDYYAKSMNLAKVDAVFFPLMVFLTGLSTLLTIYVGGLMVINGEITLGNIAEFVLYVNMLVWPVTSLGWTTSLIQRAAASQARINEFLNTPNDIIDGNLSIAKMNEGIALRNVSFTYSGKKKPALLDITFTIEQGQTLGIIGNTGSGKTTLLQLLLRQMDVTQGQISMDGVDIKQYKLNEYVRQFGYAPQDVFLFSDSIQNNIAFGMANSSGNHTELIKHAAMMANLSQSIERFANGYETRIGERGITLSGGQKQRLSLARAIAKQPNIYVFDDTFSAVDTHTEAQILANLKSLTQGKTTIIVSHRVSSIKHADTIIVLSEGKIMEQGSHQQLLALNGKYARLYAEQLEKENTQALYEPH
jgi:ATP-binding cassette, subfamily B, multidrug efflux pump